MSLVDLGFTPEKISAKHIEVDKQIISWQDFSYLVVSSFYPQSYSAAMFIYGPGIHGETDLKSILILSNGLEGLVIDKIPHIIKVVDINEDNSPELVVDIGSYTEYYEQYTILTLENDALRLVFNE